jgi:hypothetical protein
MMSRRSTWTGKADQFTSKFGTSSRQVIIESIKLVDKLFDGASIRHAGGSVISSLLSFALIESSQL